MSGSGVRIGMVIMERAVSRIPVAPVRAITAFAGAAVGTTSPGTAVPRFASGTGPATTATAWGYASRGQCRPYLNGNEPRNASYELHTILECANDLESQRESSVISDI